MRNALLVMAVFGSILFSVSEMRAQCSCAREYVNITAPAEFKLAHAVFAGKVIAVEKTPTEKNGEYTETVTFQVSKAWKQDLNSTLVLKNRIQGCLNGFRENDEWLVYVYKSQSGTLGSYCCCSRTNLLARAGEDLKALAGYEPAKVVPAESKP